jgi:hypothetical protein
MVAREEGQNIMTTGTAVTQDWDAAWESDGEAKEEIPDGRNRQSLEEQRRASEVYSKFQIPFSHWIFIQASMSYSGLGHSVKFRCKHLIY